MPYVIMCTNALEGKFKLALSYGEYGPVDAKQKDRKNDKYGK